MTVVSGGGPVFCMGGGGFTMESGCTVLDAYVLSLSAVPRPRILFLPTASGDPHAQISRFEGAFRSRSSRLSVLPLFRLEELDEPLESLLLNQDIVYVGGGSMRNLLALWRAHGVADLLREAHRRGTVLAGLSAGAMCWMEGGVSKSTGRPEPADGLGLVPGSLSVHAAQQPERGVVYRDAVASERLPGGWAVDDFCGLLFVDGRLEEAVASRPDAGAVRIDPGGPGGITESPVAVRRLDPVSSGLIAETAARRADEHELPLDVRDELRLVQRIRQRARAVGPRRS